MTAGSPKGPVACAVLITLPAHEDRPHVLLDRPAVGAGTGHMAMAILSLASGL
jgi:hypothetical protein